MEKYKILIQGIRDEIIRNDWTPGTRLPTEKDLANQYNVSRHTVRRAIQQLSADGIVESIKGSGLFLKKKESHKRLKLAFLSFSLDTYIFPSLIQGLTEAIPVSEADILLYHSSYSLEREKEIIEIFLNDPPDGLIFTPLVEEKQDNRKLIDKLSDAGVPVVFLDNFYNDMPYPFFGMDDYRGGRDAAMYIQNSRHKHIGILYSSRHQGMVLRADGMIDFFRNDTDIKLEKIDVNQQFTEDDKQRVLDFLKRKEKPSLLFCANDLIATSVSEICRSLTLKIPESISLLGFDDSPLALSGHFDSYKHAGADISRTAGEYILRTLRRGNLPTRMRTLFTPELIIRHSVLSLD